MYKSRRKTPGIKWCSGCRTHRRDEEFYQKREGERVRLAHQCKECHCRRSNEAYRRRRDWYKTYTREWLRKNPDRHRATRMANRYKADGLTRDRVWADMHDGLRCPYCDVALDWENLSYDHKNGPGTEIHPVCLPCNDLKRVFDDEDYRKIVGLLGPERLAYYKSRLPRSNYKYKNRPDAA
jgi:hypothetical protein